LRCTSVAFCCFAAVYTPDQSSNYVASSDNLVDHSEGVSPSECFLVTTPDVPALYRAKHLMQTLVDGVNNIASPTPGAKVYFLRRIPRDPMNPDATLAANLTWGKRSSTSPVDEPQEGDDVFDVYSLSKAKDLTGQPYRDW